MKKVNRSPLGLGLGLGCLLHVSSACSPHQPEATSFIKAASMSQDEELAEKIMVLNLSEAVDALFDSSPEGLRKRAFLRLSKLDADAKKKDAAPADAPVCTEEDEKVIISSKKQEKRASSLETPTESRAVEASLDSTITRTYSHEDERLECDRNLPIVEINADEDAVGLKLDIKIERQESTKTSSVFKGTPPIIKAPPAPPAAPPPPAAPALQLIPDPSAPAPVATAPVSKVETEVASSKGERQVLWLEVAEEGELLVHKKSIKGSSTRTQTTGTNQLLLTVQVAFEVSDRYREEDGDLAIGLGAVQKTIESGTVTSVRQKDGKAVTTFEKLEIVLGGDKCELKAGKIVSKIYAEGAAEPQQVVEYDAATASLKVKTDSAGMSGIDFDPERDICEREELRN